MTTARRTTGIGSLPHHNVDSALEYSFRTGIPFLPQIPIRNPWEFMLAQALEGLPGLQLEGDGNVMLNVDIWASQASRLGRRLEEAFSRPFDDLTAFEAFEPSSAVSPSWQAFIWELGERATPRAKVQIAGPMTTQWALRTKDGSPLERQPELTTQIYRLVLARAISMIRRLRQIGTDPVIYLDEPGLYGLDVGNPKHLLALQELRIMTQTLRKEGAKVGLHCCSNTDWSAVLGLGLDILSIDTALSLGHLLAEGRDRLLADFVGSGGVLSLGVVPTGRPGLLRSFQPANACRQIVDLLRKAEKSSTKDLTTRILREAIVTPACGLALQSVTDAELCLGMLTEVSDFFQAWTGNGPSGGAASGMTPERPS